MRSTTSAGSRSSSAAESERCSLQSLSRVSFARAASWVTTFISLSLNIECSFRLAEPIVSQASSTIPTFACTYTGAPALTALEERARQEAVSAVGIEEHAQLSTGVVVAGVRLGGKHDDQPEQVVGWVAQLVLEHRHDLGRPEELVLEVDEPARGTKRAEVRLEDRELASRQAPIDPLGHGPHELDLDLANRRERRNWTQFLAGDLAHLSRKCAATSATAGPWILTEASCQPIDPRAG